MVLGLGDGAGAEVGGGGAVVGTEGEAVVLDDGGLLNGGADEAPEMDGLAGPFRYRECGFAGGAVDQGHLALPFLRTVGGDIDGVLGEGSCRDVNIGSEGYCDTRRLSERRGGELHRQHTAVRHHNVFVVGCDDAGLRIILHECEVALDEDVPWRCHGDSCCRPTEAHGDGATEYVR